jgi:hypothetical protein
MITILLTEYTKLKAFSAHLWSHTFVCVHSYSLYLECCLVVVNCFQNGVKFSSKIFFEIVL